MVVPAKTVNIHITTYCLLAFCLVQKGKNIVLFYSVNFTRFKTILFRVQTVGSNNFLNTTPCSFKKFSMVYVRVITT